MRLFSLLAASVAAATMGAVAPDMIVRQSAPEPDFPPVPREHRNTMRGSAGSGKWQDRSKYMPHIGAKQRAKGLARLRA